MDGHTHEPDHVEAPGAPHSHGQTTRGPMPKEASYANNPVIALCDTCRFVHQGVDAAVPATKKGKESIALLEIALCDTECRQAVAVVSCHLDKWMPEFCMSALTH